MTQSLIITPKQEKGMKTTAPSPGRTPSATSSADFLAAKKKKGKS